MEEIIIEFKHKSVDKRWLSRYIKFISKFSVSKDYEGYKEIHHILPSSIFPDRKNLKKFEWNSVLLSGKGHFIAHFILAKLFTDVNEKNKMLFAFNNMKRINNSGALYNTLKEEGSKAISICNKGRIVYHNPLTKVEIRLKPNEKIPDGFIKGFSDYTLKHREKFHKENILVRDDNNIFYIPRTVFLSQNTLVAAATGRKHTAETKKKMSENGLKGRKKYHNYKDIIFLYEDEEIPDGFIKGDLPSKIEKTSKTMSELRSYHNPTTGESIRIKGEPPKGFIKGRGPFDNKGNKGMIPYTNGIINKFLLPEEKIPDGFWKGNKSMKMYNIYDDRGELIETIGRIKTIEKYSISIIGASKDKPIGNSKPHLSRLSKRALLHLGWYSSKIKMEDYLSKNKV